jgi:acyl-CoA thioester hydrolase
VNNANFFTYVEEARAAWLGSVPDAWDLKAFVPVLAHAEMSFLRPLGWPGQFVVELRVSELGESTMTLQHRIVDAHKRDKVYASGLVKLVWVHPTEKRKVPLPDSVRAACAAPPAPEEAVFAG